ncbi:hypothetical protein IQ03_02552 [Gemmobacter caeni]|uniref:Uncharacterized protein n=1 Tax=Gemmobacter caeni TaxID=589035 RepID=A0A2T6AYT6_9RHOB|nr:hypothetical protein [Gemmobacter caeni]PTX48976.1 hypothetical protein C8N34_10882 [Gemmobacter caeni]TWI99023.1 hypothetical protein IQ03_02552 [Gemmobacter caeni]
MRLFSALLLCLPAAVQAETSGPLVGCEVGETVTVPGFSGPGTITQDMGAICMITMGDCNMTAAPPDALLRLADTGGAGGMLTPGAYACSDPGGVADPFPLEILEGGKLRDHYGAESIWTRRGEGVFEVTQGTMNGVTGRVEGTGFVLGGSSLFTEMTCVPQA